jgi:hypothetical protein
MGAGYLVKSPGSLGRKMQHSAIVAKLQAKAAVVPVVTTSALASDERA